MLLLNLLGIFAIGSFSLEVAVADDLDDTLKQALFLVKLLQSDFAQNLRSNDDVTANSTEDENSTCSLPPEEFNSTMPMNETEVTVSRVTPTTPATPPPSMPDAPPNPTASPGTPMMMPYANWPPMAMGYAPPSGPGRRNFPDENYRFPYRFHRRLMFPDYYYFDSPPKSRGNFRRFDNNPPDDLGNTPATSQAQTTASLSSATTEATTLHMEETTATTTSITTTLGQPSTSILPTTARAIPRTTISANHTILTTAHSAKQSIRAVSSKQTILPTIAKSITATSTKKQPRLSTILMSTRRTEHRKRVGQKKRVPVLKAKTTVISKRNKNHFKVSRRRLRTHTTTTEKYTKENFEMDQVASELKKELEGTSTEDIVNASHHDRNLHVNLKKLKKETTTTIRTTTTMKVFLQGSSRIPIPFPENNGFCYYHPENALCGAI